MPVQRPVTWGTIWALPPCLCAADGERRGRAGWGCPVFVQVTGRWGCRPGEQPPLVSGDEPSRGCKRDEMGLRDVEQQQALSCWLAQAGAQQGPIISMSPFEFGQELLGIPYHSMLCVCHGLHHLSSRDRLHLQCPSTSSALMLGLPAQLVLLPVPPLWPTGTAVSLPSKQPPAAGLGYSSGHSEVLKQSWFYKPSKPLPFSAKPHKTHSVPLCACRGARLVQPMWRGVVCPMGSESSY